MTKHSTISTPYNDANLGHIGTPKFVLYHNSSYTKIQLFTIFLVVNVINTSSHLTLLNTVPSSLTMLWRVFTRATHGTVFHIVIQSPHKYTRDKICNKKTVKSIKVHFSSKTFNFKYINTAKLAFNYAISSCGILH